MAVHSAYDTFSWYKYLIVNLVFSHLGFWRGGFFLIVPFPDHCLLEPYSPVDRIISTNILCYVEARLLTSIL